MNFSVLRANEMKYSIILRETTEIYFFGVCVFFGVGLGCNWGGEGVYSAIKLYIPITNSASNKDN